MKRNLFRAFLIVALLASAAAAQAAPVPGPVTVTSYRVTTGSTFSYVDVVLHNPNPYPVAVALTFVVVQPNGVIRNVPSTDSYVPPGNSNGRLVLPFEIDSVRFVRVTKTLV